MRFYTARSRNLDTTGSMGIKEFFHGLTGKPDNMLHTPYGDFTIAKGNAKRAQKMIIELQRATEALTRQDMQDWQGTWKPLKEKPRRYAAGKRT